MQFIVARLDPSTPLNRYAETIVSADDYDSAARAYVAMPHDVPLGDAVFHVEAEVGQGEPATGMGGRTHKTSYRVLGGAIHVVGQSHWGHTGMPRSGPAPGVPERALGPI